MTVFIRDIIMELTLTLSSAGMVKQRITALIPTTTGGLTSATRVTMELEILETGHRTKGVRVTAI